jgi:alanine racemase
VAPALQAAGADFAAVATLREAVELRSVNWHKPILVLGNVLSVADRRERRERMRAIIKHRPILTVADHRTIETLATVDLPAAIDVHLKVDTGMGRLGCLPEDVIELVQTIRDVPSLRLTGIYSHFATADEPDLDLARRQIAMFREVLSKAEHCLPPGLIRHFANSAATIAIPEAHFDMVRPGIAFYGYPPAEHLGDKIDLKPILRLVAHLSTVKELPPGHCVGYGSTFTTQRRTRLGIVPIGYCDGYPRALSNVAVVSTPVGDAPVIGRVSMDHLALDLTDLPPLERGAEVTLIDDRPDRPNSVWSFARRLRTIPYEITCLLGERIQRVRVGNNCAAPSSPRVQAKPQLSSQPMCKTRCEA